ncbi:MAG: rod shape-determining protein MreD [Clostridia bacterium]|nr:rod shape-determining protein MreD [Clostridia bacterium]
MRDRKHIIYYCISVLILAVLQALLPQDVQLLGAMPQLLPVFILLIASRMEKEEAMVLGISAGFFYDIVYGRYLGFYALLYMFFAVGASISGPAFLREKKWWPCAVLPPLLFFYCMVESFFVRVLTLYATKSGALYAHGYGAHLITRILPQTLYHLIVLGLMLVPVLWILKKLEPKPMIQYDV